MLISFVIPVKDEQDTLSILVDQINQVIESIGYESQIIFVDDGSSDDSWDEMMKLSELYLDKIVAIRLRRNFGKATALAAGFRECSGEIVITMDADLQDDPQEIPNFISKIEQGYDVVSCWKKTRRDPLGKTLPSKIFNSVTAKLSGIKLHDFNCGFKAYRSEVIDKLDIYGELHRYIPVLANDLGYRITEVPVVHHERKHGESKYGWERYTRGLFDLINVLATTRYLQSPGHMFGSASLLVGGIGSLILIYLAALWFMDLGPIGNRPLFFVGIMLVILSIQLLSIGIVAELLTRHNKDTRDLDAIISERTQFKE